MFFKFLLHVVLFMVNKDYQWGDSCTPTFKYVLRHLLPTECTTLMFTA